MDFQEYIQKRNTILMDIDVDAMIDLAKEVGLPIPSSHHVALIALHKARTACTALPLEARTASKRWLLDRGHTVMDDGDVPPLTQ